MLRSTFISKMIGLGGLSYLPSQWVKTYDKFYLLQCFAAGFQFHNGINMLSGLKEGDMLALVREPGNEYDKYAIALYHNDVKIGYIPARLNRVYAKLLDIDVIKLHAEITHIQPEARSWENVSLAVYCLKERTVGTEIPPSAQIYTLLKTPRYYTVKTADDMIREIQCGAKDERIVVNLCNVPQPLQNIVAKYKTHNRSDITFKDRNIMLIDEKDVEKLLPFVKSVREVTDSINQCFTEIMFDIQSIAA